MSELFQDPKTLLFAILGGALPAVFWLWFWLKEEDHEQPEPKGLIALAFILGGIIVLIAIALEKSSLKYITEHTTQVIVWSAIEELVKAGAVMMIIMGSNIIRKLSTTPCTSLQ